MDLILGLCLLCIFSPVYLIIVVVIKLTSNGPVLYKWNVVGKNGVHFKSWKFRTMEEDADSIKIKLNEELIFSNLELIRV